MVALPALLSELSCLTSSSVDEAPTRSMSSRFRICTGNAVSPSMRLIDEPVTTTRSIFGAGASPAWPAAMAGPASQGPRVAATIMTDCFNLNVGFDMRKNSSG